MERVGNLVADPYRLLAADFWRAWRDADRERAAKCGSVRADQI